MSVVLWGHKAINGGTWHMRCECGQWPPAQCKTVGQINQWHREHKLEIKGGLR